MPLFPPMLSATSLTPWVLSNGDNGAATNAAIIAGTAYFMPVMVTGTCVCTAIRWRCASTPTGTSDAGIYDASGNQLAHTGAITNLNQVMSANLISSVTLTPGRIYLAIQGTTADTYSLSTTPATFGLSLSVAAASLLPATMTGTAESSKQIYLEGIITGGFA